jgi:hypothetical protein
MCIHVDGEWAEEIHTFAKCIFSIVEFVPTERIRIHSMPWIGPGSLSILANPNEALDSFHVASTPAISRA